MVVLVVVRGCADLHAVPHHVAVEPDKQTHQRQVMRRDKSSHVSVAVVAERSVAGRLVPGVEVVDRDESLVFVGRVQLLQDLSDSVH